MIANPAKKVTGPGQDANNTPLDRIPKVVQGESDPEEKTQTHTQTGGLRPPRLIHKNTPISQKAEKTPTEIEKTSEKAPVDKTPRRGNSKKNMNHDKKQPSIRNFLTRTRPSSSMRDEGIGPQSTNTFNFKIIVPKPVDNLCMNKESVGDRREGNKLTHKTKLNLNQPIMPHLRGDKMNQQTSDRDVNFVK